MLSVPRVDSYLEITKVIKFLKFITEDVDKTFLELVACNAGGIEYNTLNKHLYEITLRLDHDFLHIHFLLIVNAI